MRHNLSILARALYLTYTRRRITFRRALLVPLLLGAFVAIAAITRVAQWLDEILFRGYRTETVRSPIFVIAPPRSGTTFLHHLMCLDEERFTYFKTYHTLLPAVSLYKLLGFVAAVDRRTLRLLPKVQRWIEEDLLGGWQDIHPVRLDGAEEDCALFIHILRTPVFYMLFPFVDEFSELMYADDKPQEERERIMDYYERCIQRHLYACGHGRSLCTKNVHSMGRIESIRAKFPDAKFIFVVRNPYRAVPSLIGLYYAPWRIHSPDIPKDSPESRAIAGMAYEYYRTLAQACRRLERKQFICLSYEELVADPEGTILRTFEHFDLPVSDAFRARLERAAHANRRRRSRHRYSLEEYGIRPQDVHRELEDVLRMPEFARHAGDGTPAATPDTSPHKAEALSCG